MPRLCRKATKVVARNQTPTRVSRRTVPGRAGASKSDDPDSGVGVQPYVLFRCRFSLCAFRISCDMSDSDCLSPVVDIVILRIARCVFRSFIVGVTPPLMHANSMCQLIKTECAGSSFSVPELVWVLSSGSSLPDCCFLLGGGTFARPVLMGNGYHGIGACRVYLHHISWG